MADESLDAILAREVESLSALEGARRKIPEIQKVADRAMREALADPASGIVPDDREHMERIVLDKVLAAPKGQKGLAAAHMAKVTGHGLTGLAPVAAVETPTLIRAGNAPMIKVGDKKTPEVERRLERAEAAQAAEPPTPAESVKVGEALLDLARDGKPGLSGLAPNEKVYNARWSSLPAGEGGPPLPPQFRKAMMEGTPQLRKVGYRPDTGFKKEKLEGWLRDATGHAVFSDGQATTNGDLLAIIRKLPVGEQAEACRLAIEVVQGRAPALVFHPEPGVTFHLTYDPKEAATDRESLSALLDLSAWALGDLRLERPVGSCFHKVAAASEAGKLAIVGQGPQGTARALAPAADGIFLVEHDWAAAFANATDFDTGEHRLPYPATALEFRISGKRIVAIFSDGSDEPLSNESPFVLLFVESAFGWSLPDGYNFRAGKWSPIGEGRCLVLAFDRIMEIVTAQARAVSIALEAEVAESEIVRAPHKLNRAREKARKLPVRDYHVVKLANRKRALPLDHAVMGERRHPRLHFVRGHWRHFESGKTWVKWHLRGDPDLGYIEKHYSL